MRSFFFARLGLLLVCGLWACSDDNAGGGGATDDDRRLREVGDGVDLPDQTPDDGADALDEAGPDGAADTSDEADTSGLPDGDDPDSPAGPGPNNPVVGCQTNADCPANGDDPGVCCTNPNTYTSECSTESVCSGGARDACLIDAQCAARRPGEWTVCCHDRVGRNYCAPVTDTCQPVVPCSEISQCSTQATDTCCSFHSWYQASYCTSEFFAQNPERDCP